jgi:hypothetical protein
VHRCAGSTRSSLGGCHMTSLEAALPAWWGGHPFAASGCFHRACSFRRCPCTHSSPDPLLLAIADIDECAPGRANNCSANALCTNTPGAYMCACNYGFTGNGYTCTGELAWRGRAWFAVSQPRAKPHRLTGGVATRWPPACWQHRMRHIGPAPFGAVVCWTSAHATLSSPATADINECALDETNGCDANANCNNTVGSYTCACKDGFAGDGFGCTGELAWRGQARAAVSQPLPKPACLFGWPPACCRHRIGHAAFVLLLALNLGHATRSSPSNRRHR